METCENCSTTIGALETPYIFNDHVVCQSCYTRLTQPVAPIPTQPAPNNTANERLFYAQGVCVTSLEILGDGRPLPLSQVLSVLPKPGFMPGRVVVEVFDLSRASRKYGFESREIATQFIAAIRRANGSVTVEKEAGLSFFVWW